MLLAHLVPGYFASVKTQPYWKPEWSRRQRALLWSVSLFSTFAPDLDVMYNALFRGFFNHSLLWTHSLFPYLALALCWWMLYRAKRWPYVSMLVGLSALGGMSHLALDIIAHGTPLFYPLSMSIVGAPSAHVVQGGLRGYLTDPIFLFEPLLIALAALYRIKEHFPSGIIRMMVSGLVICSVIAFSALFLAFVAA
jgi:hypothetical protein